MATKYQFLRGLFAMGARGAMQDRQAGLAGKTPAVRRRYRLPAAKLS